MIMSGNSGGNSPMTYSVGARVITTGGTVSAKGTAVTCTGADEAWIYITAWSSFRQQDPTSQVLADLSAVAKKDYHSIRQAHVKDYKNLADRVSMSLGSSSPAQRAMTTTQRAINCATTYDPELIAMYFQFGRYLLISSSRQGTLPANLQGLWNPLDEPIWGSRFTLNINLRKFRLPPLILRYIFLTVSC